MRPRGVAAREGRVSAPFEVFALRQRYWEHGYRPLEVWNPDQRVNDKGEPLRRPGKQPRGLWRKNAAQDPPVAVRVQPDPRALNTGLLCGDVNAFDVDVLDVELAERIVALIERKLGPTPLVRVGRAPKTLLVYRPDQPFSKLQTPELFFADGSKAKVELLALGQQFVADGIHPETGLPYHWADGTPADVPLKELPIVAQEQCRAIVAEAEEILRDAGGREKEKPKVPERPKANGNAGDFFRQVNAAALTDIAAWARALFLNAWNEPGTRAWRVSSEDLGRDLEEDISIHPEGIRDFGEEVPLSAIDLVLRHGDAKTPLDAALWLCDKLALDPASLGYHRAKPPDEPLLCEPLAPRAVSAIPPRPWAYGHYLLFGSAAVLGAVDGGGKGAQAVAVALSMITERALLGEHVWRTGPVAIITYEDDPTEWERRIAAACLHHMIDYETVIRSFHFIHRHGDPVCLAEASVTGGVRFPDGDEIIERLKAIGAVLLIIDPFNLAHALEDGNNNVLIAKVAAETSRIAAASGAAVLVLHHLRKGAVGDPDDLMGAVALRANFRSCRILTRMTAKEAEDLGIPERHAWRYKRISGTKENYAPPPEEAAWYRLESVNLGNASEFYPQGDSVGAMALWTPPSAFEGVLLTHIAVIFERLRQPPGEGLRWAADPRTAEWIGKPIAAVTGKDDKAIARIIKTWIDTSTLIEGIYHHPASRKTRKFLTLNEAKAAEILKPLQHNENY
jgi:hypothetical protein